MPHLHFDLRDGSAPTIAQMNFPEGVQGNAADTLYRAPGGPASTSVAVRNPADPPGYSLDIVLMI